MTNVTVCASKTTNLLLIILLLDIVWIGFLFFFREVFFRTGESAAEARLLVVTVHRGNLENKILHEKHEFQWISTQVHNNLDNFCKLLVSMKIGNFLQQPDDRQVAPTRTHRSWHCRNTHGHQEHGIHPSLKRNFNFSRQLKWRKI